MSPDGLGRRRFMGMMAGAVVSATALPNLRAAAAVGKDEREDVILRPFAPSDAATVSRLIDDNYGASVEARISSLLDINRALHLSSGNNEPWHRTCVAESAGRTIGVGSALRSPMHPAARVHVIVDAQHRRQGTGRRLYASIVEAVGRQGWLPIASVIGTERLAWPFAKACGMQPLMHARQIRVDPHSWALDLWCRHVVTGSSDLRLQPGAHVAPESLYLAIGKAYYEIHRRWIETIEPEAASARHLWERKIPATRAVIATHGDEIIGAAALIEMGEGRATLFPAAACKPMADLARERQLVATLIADRLIAAREAGYNEVLIESDEDDGRMLEVLGAIPALGLIEIFTLTAGEAGFWPRAQQVVESQVVRELPFSCTGSAVQLDQAKKHSR